MLIAFIVGVVVGVVGSVLYRSAKARAEAKRLLVQAEAVGEKAIRDAVSKAIKN